MKTMKKFVALAVAALMISGSAQGFAQPYNGCGDNCCYAECCEAPCLAPVLALGAYALVTIIAVSVSNSDPGVAHSH